MPLGCKPMPRRIPYFPGWKPFHVKARHLGDGLAVRRERRLSVGATLVFALDVLRSTQGKHKVCPYISIF
jgi:hypothetical protein